MELIRKAFLLILSLLVLATIALGIGSAINPKALDELSPMKSPGIATVAAMDSLSLLLSVEGKWPDWATLRDKENLSRSISAMNEGDSKKFLSTLMVFQGELQEREHGVLELKRVVVGELAGTVLATAMSSVAFAVFFTFAVLIFSAILSRTWVNPIDWAERGGKWLYGIAGVWLFRFFFGVLLLVAMMLVGQLLRPFTGLLYSFTEVLAWLDIFLFLMWVAVVFGVANKPEPKVILCPSCEGTGKVPSIQRKNDDVVKPAEKKQKERDENNLFDFS